MKKISIFFLLLAVIICSVFYYIHTQPTLPPTAQVHIYADYTSSGGTRTFDSTLTFINKNLTKGTATYTINNSVEKREGACIFKDSVWTTATENECSIPFGILFTSQQEIEVAIHNGTVHPKKTCMHKEVCYEVLTQ